MCKQKRVIEFGIRATPRGCVAWRKTQDRLQVKRFRNTCYSSSDISANKWIEESIAVIHEMVEVDGMEMPEIIIHPFNAGEA